MNEKGVCEYDKTGRRQLLRTVGGLTTLSVVGSGVFTTAAAASGEQQWVFDAGDTIESSPTIVDRTVFIGTHGGNLYALDVETGDQQWVFETDSEIASSPMVVDGTVFIGDGNHWQDNGKLYAVDSSTGEQEWIFESGEGGIESSPTVSDGTVFVESIVSGFHAVDANTGDERWVRKQGSVGSTTVIDGTVYYGGGRGNVFAVDAETGDAQWRFETAGIVRSSPTVDEGTVFVGSTHLYAIDADTGNQEWVFLPPDYIHSSPTVFDGTVFVGDGLFEDDTGKLYAVDAETGEEMWRFEADNEIHSSPTVADETVFVGSDDSNLYAIDAETGDQQWKFKTGDRIWSSPTVINGTVFVGSNDGKLYAIDAGIEGSSEGSRTKLGTLGHHNDWRYAGQTLSFEIESIQTTKSLLSGDQLDISATINNSGYRTTANIDIMIGNTTVKKIERTLAGGETETVTASMGLQDIDPGEHTVTVSTKSDSAEKSTRIPRDVPLGAIGVVGTGISVGSVAMWRLKKRSQAETNTTASHNAEVETNENSSTMASDDTSRSSALSNSQSTHYDTANELITSAETAREEGDFETAAEHYDNAVDHLEMALQNYDEEGNDKYESLESKLISTQDELEATTRRSEHRSALGEILPQAERTFQEAIVAYTEGDRTLSRIRFRQARDQFENAIETIEASNDTLLEIPIEVTAEQRLPTTALNAHGQLDDQTVETLSQAGIVTVTDITHNESTIMPETVASLSESGDIRNKEAAVLMILSWWHAEDFEFETKSEISRRIEQATRGFKES